MNALAVELNASLEGTCVSRLLSKIGSRMYFPKGILSQSAEATERAKRFNATIGMAVANGEPMALDAVLAQLPGLTRREAVAYAPTAGVPANRESWRKELLKKNPSLEGKSFSTPVVVPGLTAGISYLADMFINEGDPVIVADMFWPNYRLIMEERKAARLATYRFFTPEGGFDVAGLEKATAEAAKASGKAVVILNYPNNPTGYTPTLVEADGIVAAMVRVAEAGRRSPRHLRRCVFRTAIREGDIARVDVRQACGRAPAHPGGKGRWTDEGRLCLGIPRRFRHLRVSSYQRSRLRRPGQEADGRHPFEHLEFGGTDPEHPRKGDGAILATRSRRPNSEPSLSDATTR